ncbi:MAG: ABC transporter ATP-binding protein [Candidatus Saccharimonadales bacterium]
MDKDVAIKVEHISKTFKLPHEKASSLKGALIDFTRHKKGYENQRVLQDISLEIKKGEFFGIVGRNGSGKSTLLKLLAGIYLPNKGEIHINGRLTPFIELGVGFNPELTGRENVFLNGALLGFNRREMKAMYQDIVDFAELDKFMDQKLKNYSSGMQVRLAFSVAIRANADILLIDEVLAVGDQSFKEKCLDYFAKIKDSGKTIVFVTHDMDNVERFCGRVFVLDKQAGINGLYSVPEAVSIYNELNHESATNIDFEKREKGEVYIKKIRLLGSNRNEQAIFMQGKQLTIEIQVDSTLETPEKITVGLAFHDKDNINLAGPNSRGHSFSTENKSILYTIKKLPFNIGEYNLTVALLDGNSAKQYDIIDRGVKFFVNTPKGYLGKVIPEDSWKIK